MTSSVIETKYPLSFRKGDVQKLGEHIRLRHSVELVGAKRVGISDLLRFFLYHKGIAKKYIGDKNKHLFIPVDLNDLVERELFPFWILTFKRLVDATENLSLEVKVKKEISNLFLSSIQSSDIFLTIENVRKALALVVESAILPTIFFVRFDRIIDVVTAQFFANLEGLIDATGQKLVCVFTSFRTVDEISKIELDRNFLHVFSNVIYVKPTYQADTKTILNTFKKRYKLSVGGDVIRRIVEVSGGHVQYLHLSILILSQKNYEGKIRADDLLETILADERISLQSEEIWESLRDNEQAILLKIHGGQKISKEEKKSAKYLWETGMVTTGGVFSPLLDHYLAKKAGEENDFGENVELTKKENALFNFLLANLDNVCEREKIIETVWPQEEEMGVSDWTIDRLVARLREKLKKQESKYQIITVKTRGFKLIGT